jgi:protein arginine kinase
MSEDPLMVRDRIGRAAGNLSYAHIITSKEALNHLSMLRLGSDLTLLPVDLVEQCDRLFMETQPAHLQWRAGRKLEPEARDAMRAQMIREQLHSHLPPAINLSEKEN